MTYIDFKLQTIQVYQWLEIEKRISVNQKSSILPCHVCYVASTSNKYQIFSEKHSTDIILYADSFNFQCTLILLCIDVIMRSVFQISTVFTYKPYNQVGNKRLRSYNVKLTDTSSFFPMYFLCSLISWNKMLGMWTIYWYNLICWFFKLLTYTHHILFT